MIQSPSLSALSMIPAAGDLPLPAMPEGAELTDFSALLALTTGQAAPAAPAGTALSGEVATPAAALADAATPGKTLPPGLPFAVPIAEPESVAAKPKTDTPDLCTLPLPAVPLAKTDVPIQRVPGQGKVLPEIDAVPVMEPAPALPQATLPALLEAIPTAPVIAAAPPLPGQVPGMEQPSEPKGDRPPSGGATPQPAPTALAHANPRAAFLRAEAPGPRGTEQGVPSAAQAPAVQPSAAQPAGAAPQPVAPQPIAQVRIELAPVPPVMRALAKDDLRPAPVAALPELPVTSATTSAPTAASAAQVPLAHQPLPLADRPQDFSALIDRLVAAREAAGPQSVSVSVAHAEFGQVHLRFRQDEAGISVAMASADPAFARAASAMPPVLPVSDPQSGQFQNGQRQDGSAASGQSGTGQQRGSTSERQGDQPNSNHTPRHAHPERQQRRAGIFA